MTENAKTSAAQNTIEDPPEYNAENAKNPKEGSDWLGGPQNGDETPSGSDFRVNNTIHYTKHRFDETPGGSTEGAYQQNGQSWLGGPQNGNETPGQSTEGAYTKHRFNETSTKEDKNPKEGSDWLGGPQNGNETPSE